MVSMQPLCGHGQRGGGEVQPCASLLQAVLAASLLRTLCAQSLLAEVPGSLCALCKRKPTLRTSPLGREAGSAPSAGPCAVGSAQPPAPAPACACWRLWLGVNAICHKRGSTTGQAMEALWEPHLCMPAAAASQVAAGGYPHAAEARAPPPGLQTLVRPGAVKGCQSAQARCWCPQRARRSTLIII